MTIKATVIADSIAPGCPRITTLQLRFPRFILPEFNTHRVFSRNASSSRAIPIDRVIQDVIDDTAMPIHWGANQAGMQANGEINETWHARELWLNACDDAIINARRMTKLGLHKQIVNRILEPYQHINVIVTATDWENFFALRDHTDAQPEIQALARAMRAAMDASNPERMEVMGWHMPYVTDDELGAHGPHIAAKISAARCASVSYKTVDGNVMTVDKALQICDKLMGDPLHASPFEHIARPCHDNDKSMTRNFTGWAQYRAMIGG